MSRGTILRGEINVETPLLCQNNPDGKTYLPKFKINTRKMIYFLKDFTNESYNCLGCDMDLAFKYVFSKAQSTTGTRRSPNGEQQKKRTELKCRRKIYCLDCATRMNHISKSEVPKFFYDFQYNFKEKKGMIR